MRDEQYIGELSVEIARRLSQGEEEKGLLEMVDGINPRRLLAGCLLLSARQEYSEEVCALSYQHPNGFIKLVLINRIPYWALRLHVWRDPISANENDIHDHCGYLVSKVLDGELVNEIYRVLDKDKGAGVSSKFLEYEDVLSHGIHTLTATGTRLLALERREIIRSGSLYYLDDSVIHRTISAVRASSMSLVLEGPRTKKSRKVYR